MFFPQIVKQNFTENNLHKSAFSSILAPFLFVEEA
jgi:hypothetical protein